MPLNADYLKEKQTALKGTINNTLLPYLFEYYIGVCSKPLIANYLEFSRMFTMFLNTPIIESANILRQPVVDLMTKLPRIFEFLDKKYEEPEKTTN